MSNRQIFRSLLCLTCVALQVAASLAQSTNLFFDRYTTLDGLSSSSVSAIAQDPNGYIWIGTGEGLNRFDGSRFVQFFHDPEDSTSIPGNNIRAVFFSKDNAMWIGTEGNGVACRKAGEKKFRRFLLPSAGISQRSSNKVTHIVEHNGYLLVGTHSGAFYYDAGTDQFRNINDGWIEDDHIPFDLEIGLIPDPIHQGIWLRVMGRMFYKPDSSRMAYSANYNPEGWKIFDYRLFSIGCVDRDGRFWFQDIDSFCLKIFDPSANDVVEYCSALLTSGTFEQNKCGRFYVDRNNTIWISRSNNAQLAMFREKGLTEIPSRTDFPGSLSNGVITDVLCDNRGKVWLATHTGLYRQKDFAFPTDLVVANPADPNETILHCQRWRHYTVMITLSHIIMINTVTGEREGIPAVETMLKENIRTAHILDGDRILLQSQNLEVFIYDMVTREVSRPSLHLEDLLTTKISLARRTGDYYWAAISPFGIARENLVTGELLFWSSDQEGNFNLPSGHVNSIGFNADGETFIALGSGKGIYKLNTQTLAFEPFLIPGKVYGSEVMTDDHIPCMHFHTDNTLYFGSYSSGMFVYREGGLTRYNRYNGLITEAVTEINTLDKERLIIQAGSYTLIHHVIERSFTTIMLVEQLAPSIFYPGGSVYEQDGTYFIYRGAFLFSLHLLGKETVASVMQPRVSNFTVFDRSLFEEVLPAKIDLSYDQNFFTFFLTDFNFGKGSTTEISYKLEGFDKDWVLCNSSAEAPFTNVPPGEYTFQVRSRLKGGEWSMPSFHAIVIHPPFWETWWFRLAVLLLIVAIVYGVYRYRLAQILKLQAVRNKIASDLHDDIGATLSSINIFSKFASDKLQENPEETRQLLHRINKSAMKMMDNMSDIVWSINPQNDTLQSLILRIRAHAAEVLGSMGIKAEVKNDIQDDLHLNMTARKNIFLVAKESINNIAKHSGADQVVLRFFQENGGFAMEITDNAGTHPTTNNPDGENLKGGNGIKNMKRRAAELGGNLEVQSVPGQGMEVILKLPRINIHD